MGGVSGAGDTGSVPGPARLSIWQVSDLVPGPEAPYAAGRPKKEKMKKLLLNTSQKERTNEIVIKVSSQKTQGPDGLRINFPPCSRSKVAKGTETGQGPRSPEPQGEFIDPNTGQRLSHYSDRTSRKRRTVILAETKSRRHNADPPSNNRRGRDRPAPGQPAKSACPRGLTRVWLRGLCLWPSDVWRGTVPASKGPSFRRAPLPSWASRLKPAHLTPHVRAGPRRITGAHTTHTARQLRKHLQRLRQTRISFCFGLFSF